MAAFQSQDEVSINSVRNAYANAGLPEGAVREMIATVVNVLHRYGMTCALPQTTVLPDGKMVLAFAVKDALPEDQEEDEFAIARSCAGNAELLEPETGRRTAMSRNAA